MATQFATTVGDSVSALTFHEYAFGNGPKLDPTTLATSFLSPTELDKSGSGVKALLAALPASPPPPPLWAGETAAANNGGQSGLTDTFVDSFWYLDQLGQLAALNVSAFLRQTLLASGGYPLVELEPSRAERREVPGAAGKVVADAPAHVLEGGSSVRPSPLPDYWLALLHKRLMGGTVLLANSTSAGVRLYAHCAVGGGVALAFLNLDESHTANLTLPRELEAATTRLEYVLTAGAPIPGAVNPLQSRQVRLNGGEPLALASGPALPPLEGKSVTQSDAPAVALPAASLGFVVWPEAHLGACARA
jgi:heparanase 1